MHNDRLAITPHDTLVQQHFRSTLPYWEQIYADRTVYGRIYQERARRAIAYLDRVGLSSRPAVLEVGCGPGVITTAMAQKGFCVSAIDCVPEMVDRTRAKARQAGLESRVFARVGNIDSLPFPDAAFELVVVIGVSEWLVSLTRPLEEIFRVLRTGGHLIISADNKWRKSEDIRRRRRRGDHVVASERSETDQRSRHRGSDTSGRLADRHVHPRPAQKTSQWRGRRNLPPA